MKISYAITVCNEIDEIKRLIPFLQEHKRKEDDIEILFDSTNGSDEVFEYLQTLDIRWGKYPFNGDFAMYKNALAFTCEGDYIFQIDADEQVTEYMLKALPQLLELNPQAELILVPRVNKVRGITPKHIKAWGWHINERQWINWPDSQTRIYKNNGDIKWEGKVHEKLVGAKNISTLPLEEKWALQHYKTIERQEKQNKYYENYINQK